MEDGTNSATYFEPNNYAVVCIWMLKSHKIFMNIIRFKCGISESGLFYQKKNAAVH